MKKIAPAIDALSQYTVLVGLLCWAGFMSVVAWWPASWWLEVASVHVPTQQAGQPVRLHVDRTIRSDFVATWAASVRSMSGQVVCSGSGTSNYRSGANLPPVLTLDWWTSGACKTLPPGRYYLATDWRIHPSGIWPEKAVRADSAPFEVLP